jgi:16S rRNA processing protein RimM
VAAKQPGTAEPSKTLEIGRIVGVFGIKGWLKVQSFTEPVEGILDYAEWCLDRPGIAGTWRVRDGRRQGRQVVASLEQIEDRDTAQRFVGARIVVEREQLPPLAPREHYRADLIGLRVVNAQGLELGRIAHFVDGPAHSWMVVRGTKEHWVPALPQQLRRVDLASGEVRVDWEPLEQG